MSDNIFFTHYLLNSWLYNENIFQKSFKYVGSCFFLTGKMLNNLPIIGTDYISSFVKYWKLMQKNLIYVSSMFMQKFRQNFKWINIWEKICLLMLFIVLSFHRLGALYFKSVTNHFLKGKYCKMRSYVFLKAVFL